MEEKELGEKSRFKSRKKLRDGWCDGEEEGVRRRMKEKFKRIGLIT